MTIERPILLSAYEVIEVRQNSRIFHSELPNPYNSFWDNAPPSFWRHADFGLSYVGDENEPYPFLHATSHSTHRCLVCERLGWVNSIQSLWCRLSPRDCKRNLLVEEGRKCPTSHVWVREALRISNEGLAYDADGDSVRHIPAAWGNLPRREWVGPALMPRWASRISMDVISVRLERRPDVWESTKRKTQPEAHPWVWTFELEKVLDA